jgi:hypothetical protein
MKKKILLSIIIILLLIGVRFSFADTNAAIQDTILSPPNNFYATGICYSVYLSWDAPPQGSYNLIGYYLYRDDIGRYAYLDNTQNTYRDWMVYTGTEYTYWVTAVYSEGESEPSDTSTAIPLVVVPTLETFDVDWHLTGWTTEPESPNNWGWVPGYAELYWFPSVTDYDMSLISPQLVLPEYPGFIGDLTVSMHIDDYDVDSSEVMEIWIVHDGEETMIFEWNLDENDDWGTQGGTDWVYHDMDQFAGETIQLKFRSHGSNTYNFNYWHIYTIFCEFTVIPPSATLEVIAADSSGNPIEGFTVNAVSTQSDVYYNAYTNENGGFTISPMIPGEYQITYYLGGYMPVVVLIYVPESEITVLDVPSVGTMSIFPTYIDTVMAPDESIPVYLTLHNHRNVPIHWFADIVNTDLNDKDDIVFQDTSVSKDIKLDLERHSVNDNRSFYLSKESDHGIMAPWESFDWCLMLDTAGQLPGTILEFDVVFTTDPNVGTFVVPITVTVDESGINNDPDVSAQLYQNYPNPFSTSTTISFNIHHRDTENAEIKIYNIKGQLIRELGFSPLAGGSNLGFGEAIWDGKDSSGKPVPSGVYLYRITTDSFTSETKKMILIR